MKPRRKKRTKRRGRKGIFVLPNLFTSACLFGGFFAIIASIQGRFEAAAIAIIIASVFDSLDGRIARFTQKEKFAQGSVLTMPALGVTC